ncbi:hypothetical protein BYT27DRAFT_6336670 [Phlegmacium glaucopus]|nr:hypothetical protein BYT27DRAFT_6336670 [Phlegmacium glaucopus]
MVLIQWWLSATCLRLLKLLEMCSVIARFANILALLVLCAPTSRHVPDRQPKVISTSINMLPSQNSHAVLPFLAYGEPQLKDDDDGDDFVTKMFYGGLHNSIRNQQAKYGHHTAPVNFTTKIFSVPASSIITSELNCWVGGIFVRRLARRQFACITIVHGYEVYIKDAR